MTRLKPTPVSGDAPELRAALEAADLPVDDLNEADRLFFRFDMADSPVAYGGLELLGDAALVRSVAVLPHKRGLGFGRQVTDTLLDRAAALGAHQAYLLTTTAAPFFERLGFVRIERANAPASVLATREATALCPSTATILTRPITKDHDDD